MPAPDRHSPGPLSLFHLSAPPLMDGKDRGPSLDRVRLILYHRSHACFLLYPHLASIVQYEVGFIQKNVNERFGNALIAYELSEL